MKFIKNMRSLLFLSFIALSIVNQSLKQKRTGFQNELNHTLSTYGYDSTYSGIKDALRMFK